MKKPQDPTTDGEGGSAAPSSEVRTLALMAFGFALVNLDRFILYPLFPVMAHDLKLDYQDLGLISAAVALTWGLSSMLFGRLSERFGRRGILIVSVLIFSLLCGGTGLAFGLGSLLLIRAVMGVFEGAFTPTSIAAVVEASPARRVGRNTGLQQLMAPLVGSAVAPVLAIQLLHVLPSWRWVFGVAALPGLLCAWLIYRKLEEPRRPAVSAHSGAPASVPLRQVLGYRNVAVSIAGFCFWLSPAILLSALMPSYLTDHLHLPLSTMSWVMSALGLGSIVGMVSLPTLSDRWGRKPVMVASLALALPPMAMLMRVGPDPFLLFGLLFVSSIFISGAIALVHSVTADNVPRQHVSTATGFIVGAGEIFGGALAPALAGGLAKAQGIAVIMPITLACMVIGLCLALLLRGKRRDALPKQAAPAH
jgi:MFS family permease